MRTHTAADPLSLAAVPTLLTLPEMAAIYRIGESTIRRKVVQRTFRPMPIDRKPLRWYKADVEADLDRRAREALARAHDANGKRERVDKRGGDTQRAAAAAAVAKRRAKRTRKAVRRG